MFLLALVVADVVAVVAVVVAAVNTNVVDLTIDCE